MTEYMECYNHSLQLLYLLAPAVKGSLHLPPGLRHVTPLHQGVVVGVFKGHFVPSIFHLLQSIKIAICKPTFREETATQKSDKVRAGEYHAVN